MGQSRQEFLQELQEVGQIIVNNAIKDHMEAHDYKETGYDISIKINDHNQVPWKRNALFSKVFVKELENKMKKRELTLEQVGLLTCLSARLDIKDNESVLRNSDGSYMSQQDISEYVGWSRNKTHETIKLLVQSKMLFTKPQEENKRKKKYYLNPKVFYSGTFINTYFKDEIEKEINK
ncbi:hypothetical protein BEH_07410 [Priestia filamentosa]|uniref:Uncharacterized protein n=1 Tax=Priestia filamentosa TaxID=1402861 RepID=A0A0H4KCV5_9BACI|nr:hypothetical protein [Priestia filamentosa]AKO91942.1 hypothetical protein BEH_07410 [Priestia filamentosa]